MPAAELATEQRAATWDSAVEISFRGPIQGSLVLAAAGRILPLLVANMLGESGEMTRELQRDALGELANVICGILLPKLAGDREVFDLQAPRLLETSELFTLLEPSPARTRIAVGLGPGRAEVILQLPEGVTADRGGPSS